MKGHLVAALALLLAACGHQDAALAALAPVKLRSWYSGRENPPPQTTAVRVGAAVSVHLEGLGPPWFACSLRTGARCRRAPRAKRAP